MQRVAILGCENSHADGFLKYLKEHPELDVEVVGVYSDESESCEKLKAEFGVYVAKTYDEFAGKIDGLIITARHGDLHYKYAKPYIKSGIPMFIDKPITISEAEARDFMNELKSNNVKVSGGSCCKYFERVLRHKQMLQSGESGDFKGAFFAAPIRYNSEYGGFYFYAQHMIQMICEVYGYYPESCYASHSGETISVMINYQNFSVTGTYTNSGNKYFCTSHYEKTTDSGECTFDGVFEKEYGEFFELLKGKEQECSYEDFFAPVFIMNAIERSLKSNKTEIVKRIGEI